MQWSDFPVPTRDGSWQDDLNNITTGPRPLLFPNPFLAGSSSRSSSIGSHICPHQGPAGTARPRMKWDLATKTWISAHEDVSVGVTGDGGALSRNTSHASSDSRKRKRGGHVDNHGTPHEAKKDNGDDGDGDGYGGGKGEDSINLSKNF